MFIFGTWPIFAALRKKIRKHGQVMLGLIHLFICTCLNLSWPYPRIIKHKSPYAEKMIFKAINLHEKLLGFLSGLRPAPCSILTLVLGPQKTFPTNRFPNEWISRWKSIIFRKSLSDMPKQLTIWLFNIAMENPLSMEVSSWGNHL